MSKQLNLEEQLNSIEAVKEFKNMCIGDYEYKLHANVIVLDREEDNEDNYLYNFFVDVQVSLDTNFHKIHIMWEQTLGDDFKNVDADLYGTYSTSYNEMEYSYKELTIYSDERKIMIRG